MCSISSVYEYGRNNIDPDAWTSKEVREAFRKLLQQAHEFDKQVKQPDCEDPEKAKWWTAIEEKHENA
jgi:hypothetical protein